MSKRDIVLVEISSGTDFSINTFLQYHKKCCKEENDLKGFVKKDFFIGKRMIDIYELEEQKVYYKFVLFILCVGTIGMVYEFIYKKSDAQWVALLLITTFICLMVMCLRSLFRIKQIENLPNKIK